MANFSPSSDILNLLTCSEKAEARTLLNIFSDTQTQTHPTFQSSLTIISDNTDIATGFGLFTIPLFWKTSNTTVKALQIGNIVTSIGSGAFYQCVNIVGPLIIPSSVTSIGSYAFFNCHKLTGSLVIPDSVTSIGTYAFTSTTGLTGSLTVPSSVTSISLRAFAGTGLTKVYTEANASVFNSFTFAASSVNIIYYKEGTTGWTNPWNGIATAPWTSWPEPMS